MRWLTLLPAYLGLFGAFVIMMVGLGALLALAIIYVTMAVTVVERTNELATLRAAGVLLRRVGATLATENLLATLLGVPVGLVLGVIAAGQLEPVHQRHVPVPAHHAVVGACHSVGQRAAGRGSLCNGRPFAPYAASTSRAWCASARGDLP